jgi:7-cyano-7-deazaguanine synthase
MDGAAKDRAGGAPAVCLLSGGLDSATVLAIARREGFACHALSFDYGQRHRFELEAARRVARALGAVDHRIVRLDLTAGGGFGHSALTDDIAVPKDRAELGPAPAQARPNVGTSGQLPIGNGKLEIPITYVPARNTIFLSIALACAEVVGAFDIFLGVNAVDYSGYPDCRGEFIEAFERLANLATAAAVQGQGRYRIHAPLIHMSKERIIRTGLSLGVDYALTHSCYDPAADGSACGHCDSCCLRLAGFAAAGTPDPARYREGVAGSQ